MTDEEYSVEALPPEPARPSIWPPFLAFLTAIALAVAAQFAVGMVIGVWYVATGGDPKRLAVELPDLLTSPPIFTILVIASQFAVLLAAIGAAYVAPVRPRGGLGFVRAAMPGWGYPILAVGSLVPLAIGTLVALAVSQVIPQDETMERVFGRVTPQAAVPFILFIALVPGFVEESLFRGYIQRRLLSRWPAWAAITVTAFLFALMHFDPALIAATFVIGLWLGALAWRTGSIWPAVVCHAANNAASGLGSLGTRFGYIPDPPPTVALGLGILLSLACFVVSLWLLSRRSDASPVDDLG
jgi:membrane protease YdiL (CAAX protease family)